MSGKRNNKRKAKEGRKACISVGALLTVVGMSAGFYAYQYLMKPEIVVSSVAASLSGHPTQDENLKVHFIFSFRNVGKSKTYNGRLYTAFVNWSGRRNAIVVSPDDFIESPLFDLTADQYAPFEVDKYIRAEELVKLVNAGGGIYYAVLCRWQGDNWVYCQRTFENNILLFMKPGMDNAKMKFNMQVVRQMYSTDWLQPERPQDRWAHLL